MDQHEVTRVVQEVQALAEARYVYPGIGVQVAQVLAAGLAEGRYPADERQLAGAVTADLQSVNGDKHLRLLYHDQPIGHREPGDDAEEYAAVARWAQQTCGGVASVQRLPGNVGYLDLQPILFPAVIGGELITAAMSLAAATEALIIDVRQCLGGEPAMAAFVISYLWDHDPVQLTGLQERQDDQPRQSWTLPYVPGRRFGKTKPVYVLTSPATFSGGERSPTTCSSSGGPSSSVRPPAAAATPARDSASTPTWRRPSPSPPPSARSAAPAGRAPASPRTSTRPPPGRATRLTGWPLSR
jgi:hypothetical protein